MSSGINQAVKFVFSLSSVMPPTNAAVTSSILAQPCLGLGCTKSALMMPVPGERSNQQDPEAYSPPPLTDEVRADGDASYVNTLACLDDALHDTEYAAVG